MMMISCAPFAKVEVEMVAVMWPPEVVKEPDSNDFPAEFTTAHVPAPYETLVPTPPMST